MVVGVRVVRGDGRKGEERSGEDQGEKERAVLQYLGLRDCE